MNRGRSVFAQLLDFVPFSHFEHLIDRYASNHGIRHFSAWTQFLCIAYSQLTRREGLRDLVACLNSQRAKLYHIGIRGKISRSTLADANERRDWRLFEALGHRLIATAVELYQGDDIGLGIKEPLYAMDSTTIDLCLSLSLFPWADFRSPGSRPVDMWTGSNAACPHAHRARRRPVILSLDSTRNDEGPKSSGVKHSPRSDSQASRPEDVLDWGGKPVPGRCAVKQLACLSFDSGQLEGLKAAVVGLHLLPFSDRMNLRNFISCASSSWVRLCSANVAILPCLCPSARFDAGGK